MWLWPAFSQLERVAGSLTRLVSALDVMGPCRLPVAEAEAEAEPPLRPDAGS